MSNITIHRDQRGRPYYDARSLVTGRRVRMTLCETEAQALVASGRARFDAPRPPRGLVASSERDLATSAPPAPAPARPLPRSEHRPPAREPQRAPKALVSRDRQVSDGILRSGDPHVQHHRRGICR